jgi:hypothetical protein
MRELHKLNNVSVALKEAPMAICTIRYIPLSTVGHF